MLLSEGEVDAAAEKILKGTAAEDGANMPPATGPPFCCCTAGWTRRLKRREPNPGTAMTVGRRHGLTYLTRSAKGDLAAAAQRRRRIQRSSSWSIPVLIEAGDWKRLAMRYRDRVGSSSDTLGFTAAYYRLSGEQEGLENAVSALRTFADHHEDEYWNYAPNA